MSGGIGRASDVHIKAGQVQRLLECEVRVVEDPFVGLDSGDRDYTNLKGLFIGVVTNYSSLDARGLGLQDLARTWFTQNPVHGAKVMLVAYGKAGPAHVPGNAIFKPRQGCGERRPIIKQYTKAEFDALVGFGVDNLRFAHNEIYGSGR